MRNCRPIVTLFFILLLLGLSGCGQSPALTDLLKSKGIAGETATALTVELRYLTESKGSNYMRAPIAGDSETMKTLLSYLMAGTPTQKPAATQYSPELRCDCEIVFICSGGSTVSLYYNTKENLLVFPEVTRAKEKDTVCYRYYSADAKLAELIASQRQFAALLEEKSVKPFRNMEQLKSSIDAEELSEEGEELDFEFYTGDTPVYTGTACSIYTSALYAPVPQDSCLITAFGKSSAGDQQKLSIVGLEVNTHYTKILVSEPDAALESIDTDEESPDSYAILVKKAVLNPSRWLVFVDDKNRVLDVILPEDIEGFQMSGGTSASATPQSTEEADAIE